MEAAMTTNDGLCPDCGGHLGDYGHCLNRCEESPVCPACHHTLIPNADCPSPDCECNHEEEPSSEVSGPRLYKVPVENLPLLRERLAKVQRRIDALVKRGHVVADLAPVEFVLHSSVVEKQPVQRGEVVWVSGDDVGTYQKVTFLPDRLFEMIEVKGPRAKAAGWEFVASLTHLEGGTIINKVPTAEIAERELATYRDVSPACDHCKTNRNRKDSFVVRSDAGELRQVGRNCLSDFLGGASAEFYARLAEILFSASSACEAAEDEPSGFGGRSENKAPVEEFISNVLAAIRSGGWISRTTAREQGREGTATADAAWRLMFPWPGDTIKDAEKPTPAEDLYAKQIVLWVEKRMEEMAPADRTDFDHNLFVAVGSDPIKSRQAGIVAYLVRYYEQAMGIEAQKKAPKAPSNHFGTVGKREVWTLTLVNRTDLEGGNFGPSFLHIFTDAEGNIAKWFSSQKNVVGLIDGDTISWRAMEIGATYRIKGTVKKHDAYKGSKQTVLTRCAVLDVLSGHEEKVSS
jgi:hypothetical protein